MINSKQTKEIKMMDSNVDSIDEFEWEEEEASSEDAVVDNTENIRNILNNIDLGDL